MGAGAGLKSLAGEVRGSGGAVEELEIRTEDGVALRGRLLAPEGKARGTVVMAHAMFARQGAFFRPAGEGVADLFALRGWRVVTFDFRGHGESGPGKAAEGARWSYDDLVRLDLPAVVASARARSGRAPVAVLGHSLGGHVALAAQGTGRMHADALVGVAANVWLRELERSALVWALKMATLRAFEETTRRRGYFPARALRQGSDDEAEDYVADLVRFAREGAWRSRDGKDDYLAALARVTVPVYAIASRGDRLNARPRSVEAMLRFCAGPRAFDRVAAGDGGDPAPGHAALVTTTAARSAFARAEEFLRATA